MNVPFRTERKVQLLKRRKNRINLLLHFPFFIPHPLSLSPFFRVLHLKLDPNKKSRLIQYMFDVYNVNVSEMESMGKNFFRKKSSERVTDGCKLSPFFSSHHNNQCRGDHSLEIFVIKQQSIDSQNKSKVNAANVAYSSIIGTNWWSRREHCGPLIRFVCLCHLSGNGDQKMRRKLMQKDDRTKVLSFYAFVVV